VFPGRLWVALLDNFLLTTPNPPELESGVQKARAALSDQGFKGSNVFLAGHSLGGKLRCAIPYFKILDSRSYKKRFYNAF